MQAPTRSGLLDGRWRLLYTSRPGTASPIQQTFVGVDAFTVYQEILSTQSGIRINNIVSFGPTVGQLKVRPPQRRNKSAIPCSWRMRPILLEMVKIPSVLTVLPAVQWVSRLGCWRRLKLRGTQTQDLCQASLRGRARAFPFLARAQARRQKPRCESATHFKAGHESP